MTEPEERAFYRALGERIQSYRLALYGLTANELAAKLSPPATRHHIYSWESGRSRIQVHKLIDLCAALGITMEELLDGI